MNKYEFISTLLEKKNLNPSQKERLIKLTVNELRSDGFNQTEINERLRQIEEQLNSQALFVQDRTQTYAKLQTALPDYISPIELSIFLRDYNQDAILKYSCHHFDEDGLKTVNDMCNTKTFSLPQFQAYLSNSFDTLSRKYKINKNMWKLINAYLNGGGEWASDTVKINWKSVELVDWSENNSGVVPNPGPDLIAKLENHGFEFGNLSFKSKLFDNRVSSFSDLVILFKNLFHLRSDNSLKDLIMRTNTREGWGAKINFNCTDIIDNIEFFTDVDKLLQAYNKIMKMIVSVSEKYQMGIPDVHLSLKEVDDCILFSIHHKNSVYKKRVRNALERAGQWETELITNQINGLCDFYIRADFGNGQLARINLWNGEKRRAEAISDFTGVEFQLLFK